MKTKTIFTVIILATLIFSCNSKQKGKHLFILSGQSNMARLHPEESFIPKVATKFGEENVIVVKDAQGGQPIRRWFKNWRPLQGNEPSAQPDLYDSLMVKVYAAIEEKNIASVTFVWMQGERDAREKHGAVYERSLNGLFNQLSVDLKRNDVNFVIGRLSDFDMKNEQYPHWTMIRDIQEKVASSNTRFAWVNTDDLNDGLDSNGRAIKDDLHMSAKGYRTLGERFASKSVELIKRNN